MVLNEAMKLYKMLRLYNYQNIFSKISEREGSLSATEAFTVDAIYILGEPTIKRFSDFLGISQPNASYKVNSLIAKGYIEKEASEDDRREHRLKVSERFYKYYEENMTVIKEAVRGMEKNHSSEELKMFEGMLKELGGLLEA